ncbi:Protein of unknown function [Pelagirhabdus alkalitolerans]|uniref:DUF2624 domain-containing protein n=1 Tax=Pelagirhabdus alkalitolerans TaxID=1612202 RepID=A0A1G6HXB8_9BACI|nr:DUF2624 family protein [Pelagirhabdus alkalitolerans]SDB98844.1 Protein of unknown function [Pelagirhabdus alkalitolerans]
MNFMFKEVIRSKIKQLTVFELLEYASMYSISLSHEQAHQILVYLKDPHFDPFNLSDLQQLFEKIERLTSPQTTLKLQQILREYIDLYQAESWFKS